MPAACETVNASLEYGARVAGGAVRQNGDCCYARRAEYGATGGAEQDDRESHVGLRLGSFDNRPADRIRRPVARRPWPRVTAAKSAPMKALPGALS